MNTKDSFADRPNMKTALVYVGITLSAFALQFCIASKPVNGAPVKPRPKSKPVGKTRSNPLRSKYNAKLGKAKPTSKSGKANPLRSKSKQNAITQSARTAKETVAKSSPAEKRLFAAKRQQSSVARGRQPQKSNVPVVGIHFKGREKKLDQHAHNWNLGKKGQVPAGSRKLMETMARRIHGRSKTIHQGHWPNQPGVCHYHFDGKHAVVTRSDGAFVTILRNANSKPNKETWNLVHETP